MLNDIEAQQAMQIEREKAARQAYMNNPYHAGFSEVAASGGRDPYGGIMKQP